MKVSTLLWRGALRDMPADLADVRVVLFWRKGDGFSGDQAAVNALRSWCTGRHRPHQLGPGLPSADLAGWGSAPELAREAAHNVFAEGYELLEV